MTVLLFVDTARGQTPSFSTNGAGSLDRAETVRLCAGDDTTCMPVGTANHPMVVTGSVSVSGGSSSGGATTVYSGAPRFTTASVGPSVVQLFAATSSGAARTMFSVTNPAANAPDLFCTDDGSTPSASNADFIVYGHGNTYRSAPEFVSNQAIQCVTASTASATPVTAEVYP